MDRTGGFEPDAPDPAGSSRATFVDGEWILFGDDVDQDALDFMAVTAEPLPDDPQAWSSLPPDRRRGVVMFGLGLIAAFFVVGFVIGPRIVEQPTQIEDKDDGSLVDVRAGGLVSITLPEATWQFTDLGSGVEIEGPTPPPTLCLLDEHASGCGTKRLRVMTPGSHQISVACRTTCGRGPDVHLWSVTLMAA